MRLSSFLLCCACLLPLTACSSRHREAETGAQPATQSPSLSPSLSISADVLTIPEVRALIASHQGKVVVVDLWALW